MTFGESLVFLVALLSGILDSIEAAGGAAHGDNIGTSLIGISALNQYLYGLFVILAFLLCFSNNVVIMSSCE